MIVMKKTLDVWNKELGQICIGS